MHSNLKPQNLLISKEGKLKIGDCGIRRLISVEDSLATTKRWMNPKSLNIQ